MSRPKYWWDGTVKKGLRLYYKGGLDTGTIQGSMMHIGITRAIRRTELLPDGRDRMRIIELCYMCGAYNIAAAADNVHVSERTAQRWIAEFVKIVGREMGYV